jgi:iron complex transport system ATP-binding protein
MSIKVEGLTFGYGDRTIVKDVSFDGADGRIISVLGPNGVGKTTLLKCLCRILQPGAGTVTVDGEDVLSMPKMGVARMIGYVPQHPSVTRTTVFDSVLIGRRPHMGWGLTKKDLTMTRDAVRAMGLSGLSMRHIDEISGGELQKAQIARAIVQDTRVLVLDEPTSSLDIVNQHRTMRLIKEAVKGRQVCTIMSMHDINLAACCSDELMFMKGGRVVARGPPSIVSRDVIKDVYGIDVDVMDHNGLPVVVPSISGLDLHPSRL